MRSLIVALLLVVFVPALFAQQAGTPQKKSFRNYDPRTEVTVRGAVQDVTQQSMRPGCTGTHVVLKTDRGPVEVHLAPTAYIQKVGLKLAKEDAIEVTGSKQKINGAEIVIAREVKAGGATFSLRDAQGIPAWSGGKNR